MMFKIDWKCFGRYEITVIGRDVYFCRLSDTCSYQPLFGFGETMGM